MARKYPWFNDTEEKLIIDKDSALKNYRDQWLCRLQMMFKYNNLPPTIPARNLELMLQTLGHVFITKHNDNLFALTGGLGGYPDGYFEYTEYIVANPYLNITKQYKINVDGILVRNDALMQGVLPIVEKSGVLLNEMDITMRNITTLYRALLVLTGSDSTSTKAANDFFDKLEKGDLTAIQADSSFMDGITNVGGIAKEGLLKEIIEAMQYVKSNVYGDLGININGNMKREYVSDSEQSMSDPAMLPFVENMLRCRQEAMDQINQMFGTEITVELDSSWKVKNVEVKGEPEDEEQTSDGETDGTLQSDGSETEEEDSDEETGESGTDGSETEEDETTEETVEDYEAQTENVDEMIETQEALTDETVEEVEEVEEKEDE